MKSESNVVRRVCVLNGIHRGAVIAVGEKPTLVGGGDDCDALLADVSASDSAILVSLDHRDRLSVTAVRGDVHKNGRAMRLDRASLLGDGAAITLGDVKIVSGDDIAGAQASIDGRLRRRTIMSWGAVCAVSLALFGFLGAIGGPADAYNSAQTAGRSIATSDIARQVADPVRALNREIASNDLADRIEVVRKTSGQLIATGVVSTSEKGRWDGIVRWFDGRFGDKAALESRVTVGSDGVVLPFEIVSILASPNPRIVIQNGNAFPVGSFLPGGWEVKRIADMTVVLTREDRELSIDF